MALVWALGPGGSCEAGLDKGGAQGRRGGREPAELASCCRRASRGQAFSAVRAGLGGRTRRGGKCASAREARGRAAGVWERGRRGGVTARGPSGCRGAAAAGVFRSAEGSWILCVTLQVLV